MKIYDFESIEVIGVGAYGKVVKARHKTTGMMVAIKHVDKDAMERMELEEQLINEIRIMKALNHPNILKLLNCFEDYKNVHLVMELSTEGSLYKKISKDGMSEECATVVI
jgi:calcium-dependent protein kinase